MNYCNNANKNYPLFSPSVIRATIPIGISFIFIYFSLGLLGSIHSLGAANTLLSTALIFAGPTQTYLLDTHSETLLSIMVSVFLLNIKFALMSTVLLSVWQNKTRSAKASLFFVGSSSYFTTVLNKNDENLWRYYLGISLISYTVALCATLLGYYTWQFCGSWQKLLSSLAHIVMPIHFLSLVFTKKDSVILGVVTVFGIIASYLARQLVEESYLILCWLLFAIAAEAIISWFKQPEKECFAE